MIKIRSPLSSVLSSAPKFLTGVFAMSLFVLSSTSSVYAENTIKKIDDKELNIIDKEWKPNESSEAIQKNEFLKKLKENGVQIIPLGNEEGFDGWLAHKDEEVQIFYTVPHSNAVLTGTMISQSGENLTAFQLIRYEAISGNEISKKVEEAIKAKEALPESEKFYAEVEKSLWLGYGGVDTKGPKATKNPPYLYVFMTPDCNGCKSYFESLVDKYAKNSLIEVRAIPVFVNDKQKELLKKIISQDEAAMHFMLALLGASETQFEDMKASSRAESFLQANNDLLSSRKLDTYPLTVYRSAKGEVKIIKGVPKNVDDVAADLTIK